MHTTRAVSAALHTPQLGGAQTYVHHHLVPERKLRSKYEALAISEVRNSGVTRGLSQRGKA